MKINKNQKEHWAKLSLLLYLFSKYIESTLYFTVCAKYNIVRDQRNNSTVGLGAISDLWLVYKNKRKKSAYSWMLTWPHTSSPNPINTHHIHWSSCRGEQLNGFPPNWTITIYKEKQRRKGGKYFLGKKKTQTKTLHPQNPQMPAKKTQQLSVMFQLRFYFIFLLITALLVWFQHILPVEYSNILLSIYCLVDRI